MNDLWAQFKLGVAPVTWSRSYPAFTTTTPIDDQANSILDIDGTNYEVGINVIISGGYIFEQLSTSSNLSGDGGVQYYEQAGSAVPSAPYQAFAVSISTGLATSSTNISELNNWIPTGATDENFPNEIQDVNNVNDLDAAGGIQGSISFQGYVATVQSVSATAVLPSGQTPATINAPLAVIGENAYGFGFNIYYPSYVWVNLGPAPNLYVSPIQQSATIILAEDTTGSITSSAQTGTIQFTDTDPTTTPTGAIKSQTVTASDAKGNAVTLTGAEISALESAFTIAPADGNTNDGEIDWTYNPGGTALTSLAGETAVDTATVEVTDQDGNSATAQVTITVVGPDPILFTTGADVVDFNNLTPEQQAAIQDNPGVVSDGLGGNDSVVLPIAANFNENIGNGDTLNWSSTTPFQTGSRPGDTYTVEGSDGDYDLQLGAGSDSVTISGDGSSRIAAGSGADTIAIDGKGDNTINGGGGNDNITVGNGNNSVSLSGDGDNTVTIGSGDDTVDLSGDGDNSITGGGGGKNIADSITLGGGSDSVTLSGDSNDTVNVGSGSDTINLSGNGDDNITIADGAGSTDNIALGGGRDIVALTGDGSSEINAGSGDDTITIAADNKGQNTINLASVIASIDSVNVGGDSANTVSVGAGKATITLSGNGVDAITGLGYDTVTVGNGTDSITLDGAGINSVTAGSGNDTINLLGSGDDNFSGGGGNYNIALGAGKDTVNINGNGSSDITTGTDDDTITITGDGDNTITDAADSANVTIIGKGDNTFDGDLIGSLSISGGGSLEITGNLKGTATIGAGSTLTIDGTEAGTVTFNGADGTLEINQAPSAPQSFSGKILGLTLGDKIELANTNNVYSASIGNLDNKQTLEILEGYATLPQTLKAIRDDGTETGQKYYSTTEALDYDIQGDNLPTQTNPNSFFSVGRTPDGSGTIFTLTSGNPIDLAVNGPTVQTGAGVKIGVISGKTDIGEDEDLAMIQVINSIAPDVRIFDPMQIGVGSALFEANEIVKDISILVGDGCNIIVDDLGASDSPEFQEVNIDTSAFEEISSAMDKAVKGPSQVSYFTVSGNGNNDIAGFNLDPNVITVGAVNWLATPGASALGPYITPAKTEPFSQPGVNGKPDVSGPDGGPTLGFALGGAGLDPFFGTSAASPAAAAVAALAMSANPALKSDPEEVKNLLEETATPFGAFLENGYSPFSGYGLVNAAAAVTLATSGFGDFFTHSGTQPGLAVASASISQFSDGEAATGSAVNFAVAMNEAVTVSGGAPALMLNDGGVATYDAAESTPSSGRLAFDYTVASADQTSNLNIAGISFAPGDPIQDADGNNADLSVLFNLPTGLTINSPLVVQSVLPSQTAEVGSGEAVQLTLKMSEPVTVNPAGGAPTLTLNDGATATYDAQASNPSDGALVFDYTVGVDDATPNLEVANVTLPTGTTVQDLDGNNADFSAAVDYSTGLQIGPTYVAGVAASHTGEATTGQTVQIALALSERVTVDTSGGLPTLQLNDGEIASYDATESNPSTGLLLFDYTVASGDQTPDIEVSGVTIPTGSSIEDTNGVAVDFSAALNAPTGLTINSPLTVASLSTSLTNLAGSNEIQLTLTMTEPVFDDAVGSPPTLTLNDGETATFDPAASNLGTGSLVFDYLVQPSDSTGNLSISSVTVVDDDTTLVDANDDNADFSAGLGQETGIQIVATGETSNAASLTSGAQLVFGTADDATIGGDATQYVLSGGTTSNTYLETGGIVTVCNGGALQGATIAGGELDLQSGSTAGQTINFSGSGGVLQIDGSTEAGAILSGLSGNDAVDLSGLTFVNGQSNYSAAPQMGNPTVYDVTVDEGTASFTILYEQSTPVTQNEFTLTQAGAGTELTSAPCYCRGTRILTDRGEVAVEALAVGDLAVTASGRRRPIVWIGHRKIDISRHPDPAAVRPVRISAGAFVEGLPSRDLWLSPGHNVPSEGALMPISALINGVSVAQIEQDSVEYWHIELDAHDIILAEGLPAESYLDCGNRTGFANGGAFIEAHPDFAPKHWAETCLPLATQGREVARARVHLFSQLPRLGFDVTTNADPHILADGCRIEPTWLDERQVEFEPPTGSRAITLRSRTFVPAFSPLANGDMRELGLSIARLQIDGVDFALDDWRLEGGWRDCERDEGRPVWRWTDGAAALPKGAKRIVIDLAGEGLYWRIPENRLAALVA